MPHLDPEQLSLLALYEGWDDPEGREHLRACPECAADYAALRRTVEAVRTAPDTSRLSMPGPEVWAGIHRELGLDESLREDPLAVDAAGVERAAGPGTGSDASPASGPGADAPGSVPPSNVVPFRGQPKAVWWRRPGPWLAATAAAVLVAFGGIWALNRPQPQQLAAAQLEPLPQHSAAGSARVVAGPDGSRSLQVTLDKDEARGYQEVWLIAPDLSRLVSLGVMNSTSGTFQVPAGLDLSQYPVVDVSDEPVDGNPAHSSVSIARGALTS
jgi:hypothetical protein